MAIEYKPIVDTAKIAELSNDVITYLLAQVAKHQKENPRHGYNCACIDPVIRVMRKVLYNTDISLSQKEKEHGSLDAYFNSEEVLIERRWEYILAQAAKHRAY